MKSIFSEEVGQGEYNALYMLLIFIIAALLVITVAKPMFRQSQQIVQKTPVVTSST